MRKYFKNIFYLVVASCIFSAFAGSYEDFFIAIKQDDGKAVRSLLERGFDANVPGPDGLSGLFIAMREPSAKAAEVLIDWPRTQVEFRSPADESPLMMAALKGQFVLARKLIDRGADVNKPGWTPLHYAATHGHLDIMNLLIEHSAYIDAESPNGTTPLMMAAHYGTLAGVKLLLEAGADPTLKNQLGLGAIDFAQRANRSDAAELIAAFIRGRQPNKGTW